MTPAIEAIVRLWGELDTLKRDHHLEFLRQPDAGLAWVAFLWAEGDDLDQVVHGSELAAGDFVRWMRLLVDLTARSPTRRGDAAAQGREGGGGRDAA